MALRVEKGERQKTVFTPYSIVIHVDTKEDHNNLIREYEKLGDATFIKSFNFVSNIMALIKQIERITPKKQSC